EFPADAAISKLEVEGKQILTVSLRDVTSQKQIESEQRFLAEVGSVFAATLEYEETLTSVARLAVRELADLCVVDMVAEGGEVRRLKVVSRDPARARACALLMQVPRDRGPRHLGASALATKRPVLVEEVTSEVVAGWAESEEHLRAFR